MISSQFLYAARRPYLENDAKFSKSEHIFARKHFSKEIYRRLCWPVMKGFLLQLTFRWVLSHVQQGGGGRGGKTYSFQCGGDHPITKEVESSENIVVEWLIDFFSNRWKLNIEKSIEIALKNPLKIRLEIRITKRFFEVGILKNPFCVFFCYWMSHFIHTYNHKDWKLIFLVLIDWIGKIH